jgi:hypothetical protein
MACPAGVLPVRVTAATRGSAITSPMRAEPRRSVRKTPFGAPAASNNSSMANAHPVTFDECLSTVVLPAIRVGAA